jgi:3'-phosphoadenosine 5'-phosphosulfate sulfotransferase (PAPS reductase)/FAD synthetase
MTGPFRLPIPFVVSFSGGRTSAYMLRRILNAFGGQLPAGGLVLFANTGKERPETLDFVERCSTEWDCPVVWLEYRRDASRPAVVKGKNGQPSIGRHGWAEVNYATASRDGRPLDDLFRVLAEYRDEAKGADPLLPNVTQRFCTAEGKIRTMGRYVTAAGFDLADVSCAVGIRADEPARLAKLARQSASDWKCGEPCAPLAPARVTEPDVMAFWSQQSFDLKLRQHEGNCDLCFLKSRWKINAIMRDRPDLAQWWIDAERRTGMRFRNDRPSYAAMLAEAGQPALFHDGPDQLDTACHCTD